MNELNCEYVRDTYPDVLNGTADRATATAVQAHLEQCVDCREEAEAVAGIFAGSLVAPPGLHERVLAEFGARAPRHGRRLRYLAMAATVAAALIGGSLLFDTQPAGEDAPRVVEAGERGIGVVTVEAALVSGTESLQDLTVEELEKLLGEIES